MKIYLVTIPNIRWIAKPAYCYILHKVLAQTYKKEQATIITQFWEHTRTYIMSIQETSTSTSTSSIAEYLISTIQ